MSRKIAIVGAGAVGGYAGAHMVQAGEDVTFIDPGPRMSTTCESTDCA
jgi:2-dehydropantoate 2-reductase